jgi:hypothetical protein
MGLDEPAVPLRLERRELDLLGRDTQVEPGRERSDIDPLAATEDELRDDLLVQVVPALA